MELLPSDEAAATDGILFPRITHSVQRLQRLQIDFDCSSRRELPSSPLTLLSCCSLHRKLATLPFSLHPESLACAAEASLSRRRCRKEGRKEGNKAAAQDAKTFQQLHLHV